MENLILTSQPVIYLGLLLIKIIKLPSASVKPVINQGFNKLEFINISEALLVVSLCKGTTSRKRVDQYSLLSVFRAFPLINSSSLDPPI